MAVGIGGAKAGVVYRYGKTLNQQSHTWRHIDKLSISRYQVRGIMHPIINKLAPQMKANETLSHYISIGGHDLRIVMRKFENGEINIGRINEVR